MMGRSNEREGAALPRGDYSPGMSKPNTERPGPPFIQSVLEVRRKEQLTPHLMRVVLTGEDIPHFEDSSCLAEWGSKAPNSPLGPWPRR